MGGGGWPRLGKVPVTSCWPTVELVSLEPLWPDLRFQWTVRPNAWLQGRQSGALCSPWVGLLQPKENKTSQSPTFNYSAHNWEAPVLPPDQAVSSSPCSLQSAVQFVQCAWELLPEGRRPASLLKRQNGCATGWVGVRTGCATGRGPSFQWWPLIHSATGKGEKHTYPM